MTYRIELEDDEMEVITADSDDEAIDYALSTYDWVFNVIKLDENYDEIETIF